MNTREIHLTRASDMTTSAPVDVNRALRAVQECRSQVRNGKYQEALVNTSIALVYLEAQRRADARA